jgi:hypothetical protein
VPPRLRLENTEYVAIKILDKKKLVDIGEQGEGVYLLLNEIRVHWSLSECDGIL